MRALPVADCQGVGEKLLSYHHCSSRAICQPMTQRQVFESCHAPQVLCLGLATALAVNGGAAWRGFRF